MMREGWWRCWSNTDPRWDMEGRGYIGMFSMPAACRQAINAKRRELGEEPPDDLEYSYMKD